MEEEVPLNQTSHTTDIDPNRQYGFRLVLYDGDVVVQSLENPVSKENEGNNILCFICITLSFVKAKEMTDDCLCSYSVHMTIDMAMFSSGTSYHTSLCFVLRR